jgi:hypothetical protein
MHPRCKLGREGKKMKVIIFRISFLLIFCISNVQAQNLVPNGDFESYTICPNAYAQIYQANGWFQPRRYLGFSFNQSSSSDYFNACATITAPNVSVPYSGTGGYQQAHSGDAYIGLSYYTNQEDGNAYREYAQVKLNQTLVANQLYKLKYFISLANFTPCSIVKFDAYFSLDTLIDTTWNFYRIPVTPQIQYNARISDTLNWVEVNGSFIANGTERFLTLGNFHEGSTCDTLSFSILPYNCFCYYLIDDVSLFLDSTLSIIEEKGSDLKILPNPANEKFSISYTGTTVLNNHFILYELCGLEVKRVLIENGTITIGTEDLVNGFYYWKFNGEKGKILIMK